MLTLNEGAGQKDFTISSDAILPHQRQAIKRIMTLEMFPKTESLLLVKKKIHKDMCLIYWQADGGGTSNHTL